MRTNIIDVTPELAQQWLASNSDRQRKLRKSVVSRYARDMAAGHWVLTHQGVAFDSGGQLIDGQHRLAAVIEADVPVKMLVVTDAPKGAFDHVDLGLGRTATDIFKAQGEEWIDARKIAIAKFIEYGDRQKGVSTARSPFELRQIVERHKNAIHFVLQNVERQVRGITTAPVLAAVCVAYYCEPDRVKLAEFLHVLVSGMGQGRRGELTIRFRDWLRDTNAVTSGAAREEMFLKAQRVIKAFMNDEHLSRLYTPTEAPYNIRRRNGKYG